MYSGRIEGIGARYCPSIEDKVMRFRDKTQHRVFLEPEGLTTSEVYVNGLSTSLPEDVQTRLPPHRARTRGGGDHPARLRRRVRLRAAHGTEADAGDQAGARVCTTPARSTAPAGYEEAAAQGLVRRAERHPRPRGPGAAVHTPERGLPRRHDRRHRDPGRDRALSPVHVARRVPASAAPRQRRRSRWRSTGSPATSSSSERPARRKRSDARRRRDGSTGRRDPALRRGQRLGCAPGARRPSAEPQPARQLLRRNGVHIQDMWRLVPPPVQALSFEVGRAGRDPDEVRGVYRDGRNSDVERFRAAEGTDCFPPTSITTKFTGLPQESAGPTAPDPAGKLSARRREFRGAAQRTSPCFISTSRNGAAHFAKQRQSMFPRRQTKAFRSRGSSPQAAQKREKPAGQKGPTPHRPRSAICVNV
jgi:hypothetical protein